MRVHYVIGMRDMEKCGRMGAGRALLELQVGAAKNGSCSNGGTWKGKGKLE